MQPFLGPHPLFLHSGCLVYACPGGAWLELEAISVTLLPLAVLLGHLLMQIVLTEPLFFSSFLPAPMAADQMILVQIKSPFSAVGPFLHDIFPTLMVLEYFSGKFRTFSGPHGHKSLLPSYRFHPNWPPRCRTYARSHRHQKRYPSGCL